MSVGEIRIRDLDRPVWSDMERMVIEAAQPVQLTEQAVLDAARAATGLADFGPDDFRERLRVWLQSFDEDRGLNLRGREDVFNQTVRYAAARLRVEDLVTRHPEIACVRIDRPVVIAGLPRSGTTHLVNTLAANPALRSMPLWESMEPVPRDDERVYTADDTNPRYQRCVEMWHVLTSVLEHWPAMHEMAPDHVHEEVELQCLDFSSYMPEWLAWTPRWQQYYYDHDQTPHYAYARKVLQAMTWLHGPDRWLLKSPPNMENLPAVLATYPDACVVITHRDPVAVIQSAVTMMAYWDRIRRRDVDPPGLAAKWINRIERLLRACVRDRDQLPEKQVVDVLFHEFMADQPGAVRRVHEVADIPCTPDSERAIADYLRANTRGRLGKVVYDLEGDFGVDVGALRERFAFYYDRFPVAHEPTLGEK